MKNNIIDKENNTHFINENEHSDIVNLYESITHMNTLIGNFQNKSNSIENIFKTLQDGKITSDLSFTRRDELIDHLEKEKHNLEKLFEDYINSLRSEEHTSELQ